MGDGIRVTVETDGARETVRIHDDAGTVEVGDATFSFAIDGGTGGAKRAESQTDHEDEGGSVDAPASDDAHLVSLDDVPTRGTMRWEALAGRRGVECILRRDGETVAAWRNSCPHKPEVKLDPGIGALTTDEYLICHEHGARFKHEDGFCTRGPCRGASLDPIAVAVRDGDVYLTDDRFDACRPLGF